MAAVIRVHPQPEPLDFVRRVRQPGLAWIHEKGLDPDQPAPAKTEIKACWRACLDDLHTAYSGICAYLCVFIERETGGTAVEHFVARSRTKLSLAYEWNNYRLACAMMNSRKLTYDDVLDPFTIPDGMFHLELVTVRIFPDPNLAAADRQRVQKTIARLKLDSPGCRAMRARHLQDCLEGHYTAAFLRRQSPFVWAEAARQGVLRCTLSTIKRGPTCAPGKEQ
jgi:hypothetical protein